MAKTGQPAVVLVTYNGANEPQDEESFAAVLGECRAALEIARGGRRNLCDQTHFPTDVAHTKTLEALCLRHWARGIWRGAAVKTPTPRDDEVAAIRDKRASKSLQKLIERRRHRPLRAACGLSPSWLPPKGEPKERARRLRRQAAKGARIDRAASDLANGIMVVRDVLDEGLRAELKEQAWGWVQCAVAQQHRAPGKQRKCPRHRGVVASTQGAAPAHGQASKEPPSEVELVLFGDGHGNTAKGVALLDPAATPAELGHAAAATVEAAFLRREPATASRADQLARAASVPNGPQSEKDRQNVAHIQRGEHILLRVRNAVAGLAPRLPPAATPRRYASPPGGSVVAAAELTPADYLLPPASPRTTTDAERNTASKCGELADYLRYAALNGYTTETGKEMAYHTDVRLFGHPIALVTTGSEPTSRFNFKHDGTAGHPQTFRSIDVGVADVVLFYGVARSLFEHAVPAIKKDSWRFSVTLRGPALSNARWCEPESN